MPPSPAKLHKALHTNTHTLKKALTHTGTYMHIYTYMCTHLRSGVEGRQYVHTYTGCSEQLRPTKKTTKNQTPKTPTESHSCFQFLVYLVVLSPVDTYKLQNQSVVLGFPPIPTLLPSAGAFRTAPLLVWACCKADVNGHTRTPPVFTACPGRAALLAPQPGWGWHCCSRPPQPVVLSQALFPISNAGAFPHRPFSPFAFSLPFFFPPFSCLLPSQL